jgi:hypothetical protein
VGRNTSSIKGASLAVKRETMPTRLVRASVVDIRTAISKAGIPRTQVDCIGVTSREVVNGAVLLGWSGMQWQSSRPVLRPTTRNIITGKQFSDNAVDRMAEMAYDSVSAGWDGDDVCVAFYGRSAVVLGTFQHGLAWEDVEPGEVENFLEPGRRLQDDPEWDVTNVDDGGDRLFVAQNDSHPDAMVFRWGRVMATVWDTRGLVFEVKRPNHETGKEGTLYTSRNALLEMSPQWFAAESRNIRLVTNEKDISSSNTAPPLGHILEIGDGSKSSYGLPGDDWRVNGIAGFVSKGDTILRAFSATYASGGDNSGDALASATRYPELKSVIDSMQAQIDDLRDRLGKTGDWLWNLLKSINDIIVVQGTGGAAALLKNGLSLLSEPLIEADHTPTPETPSQQKLTAARSSVFRVGR